MFNVSLGGINVLCQRRMGYTGVPRLKGSSACKNKGIYSYWLTVLVVCSLHGDSPQGGSPRSESSWDRMVAVRGESPATVGEYHSYSSFITPTYSTLN